MRVTNGLSRAICVPLLLGLSLMLVSCFSGELPPISPTPFSTERWPAVETQAVPVGMSTLPPMPTLVPTITPTPVPLPEVCLLDDFAGDTALCSGLTHYEIALSIEPSLAHVTGHQEVLYTNMEDRPLSDIYLRLFPNTPNYGGTMAVTNIFVGGLAVTPIAELQTSALRLPLAAPLRAGESVTLTMDFGVRVPTTRAAGHGLFSYVNGVMALPDVYPFIPVYDDEGWNVEIAPTHSDDVYADVAAYEVTVSVPDEFTVITSGSCSQFLDGMWICEAAPVREFALVLGRDYERASRMVGDVVVNSYYYTGHEAGGSLALDVAERALSVFSDLFGPYPYTELDVVETPNYLGGMEYPGLVVIEDSLYPTGSRVEWLTAHEVAHQWWFGLVGSDQIDEPWLDEALTQYSTFLYYEAVYGPERAKGVLNAEFIHTHRELVRSGLDLPVGLPAFSYSSALYWQVVYDKGALYFHNLREAIGDDAFFEVLQVYFQDNRYSIATPEDWLAAVEKVTGDKHLAIYQTWITGSDAGGEE